MGRRETLVARSIVFAILNHKDDGKPPKKPTLLGRALRLFNLYWLTFELLRNDLFRDLRTSWGIPEGDYKASFLARGTTNRKLDALQALGDMGFSGSTFFSTSDSKYLVKSIPRNFENSFFKKELVEPYATYMTANKDSILVRITDFLQSRHKSIGMLLGLAPSHHIIMDNLLCGSGDGGTEGNGTRWESWDLKPTSFFYPERDIAGGALTSESTKARLPDKFEDKIYLTQQQKDEFTTQLRNDTRFLADANIVDYSLFLVRIVNEANPDAKVPSLDALPGQERPQRQEQQEDKATWRTGIPSPDGKQVYRATVLDFFWSKHSMHAKAMTSLIKTYNVIDEQGPMSITAESSEYRDRFLKMCEEIIEVRAE